LSDDSKIYFSLNGKKMSRTGNRQVGQQMQMLYISIFAVATLTNGQNAKRGRNTRERTLSVSRIIVL
jgi:hypothetical protein